MEQGSRESLLEAGPMNLTLTVTLIIVNNVRHNSRVDKEKAESTVSNQAWLDLNYNELWTVSIGHLH